MESIKTALRSFALLNGAFAELSFGCSFSICMILRLYSSSALNLGGRMKRRLVLLSCCALVLISVSHSQAQDTSIQSRLTGKWTQHYTGMSLQGATLNITSIDSTTGQLKGKWIPPSGAAGGKEFEVIGWVSSASPREKLDN